MLSDDTIKFIASIFCGDMEEHYTYKSGPMLVRFLISILTIMTPMDQGFHLVGDMYLIS